MRSGKKLLDNSMLTHSAVLVSTVHFVKSMLISPAIIQGKPRVVIFS
jgi:hypothetical protein